MKVKNPLSFNGQFETVQDYNSSFYRTKIRVFAFGNNVNGSHFSHSSFEKAKESIKLIPIVAKYNKDNHDLEGHNVILQEDNNGELEVVFDTYPIGVVSNDTSISFEEVNEGSDSQPIYKTYVVIDNVYLWKRYKATQKIQEWIQSGIAPKISMEIDNVEAELSDDGYFKIENFEFQAIAALGSDVEPAFKMAEIQAYSKEQFSDDFKTMVFELKQSLNEEEGGTDMAKEKEKLQEEEVEINHSETENQEEETKTQIGAPEYSPETEGADENKESKPEEETPEKEADEPQDEEKEETDPVGVDYKQEFSTVAESHKKLTEELLSLESELAALRSYKRMREENDLKEKFSKQVSEDEFTQVFTEMKDSAIEEIEVKLFALVGQKNFSIKKEDKEEINKAPVFNKTEEEESPYGDLFN